MLGTEAVSYLRLIDSCITQLKAQGPSRTCNESKEEEEEEEEGPLDDLREMLSSADQNDRPAKRGTVLNLRTTTWAEM